MATKATIPIPNPLERHFMAVEEVQRRLERIVAALNDAGVAYALVGGQAVALWVSTLDPHAVRTPSAPCTCCGQAKGFVRSTRFRRRRLQSANFFSPDCMLCRSPGVYG
jgi:hypothetical protein